MIEQEDNKMKKKFFALLYHLILMIWFSNSIIQTQWKWNINHIFVLRLNNSSYYKETSIKELIQKTAATSLSISLIKRVK